MSRGDVIIRQRTGHGVFDGNANKTPFVQSMNRFAEGKALDAIHAQGFSLPCKVTAVVSPGIVTVAFAVDAGEATLQPVTIPILAPPYFTLPIQVGDAGITVATNVRTGQLSGQGGGTQKLWSRPANLSPLHFIWLGTTGLTTIDPDAVVTMGNLSVSQDKLGFFANPKVAKQTITGALSAVTDPAAKAVLTSIVAALCDAAGYGLTTDGTS